MMTLYSTITCPYSHRCRIVLHEKDMDFQVIDVDPNNKSEDLAVMSPYGKSHASKKSFGVFSNIARTVNRIVTGKQIGRASCRERVYVLV